MKKKASWTRGQLCPWSTHPFPLPKGLPFLIAGLLFSALLILPGSAMPASAAEPVSNQDDATGTGQHFELDEMVVTATRGSKSLGTIPKNVTVITSEEIALSPANNIVDLLGRESGLNIRSVTGNEGKSGIDIRGMGDTYVSNVIIMVDGFRLNAADMSGADFLSVPLGEVDRIEIVRGGGSVLYGDGAVGGVINIITKKPTEKLTASVSSNAGSFETYSSRARLGGKTGRFSFSLSGGQKESEGYRDNGGLREKDTAVKLGLDLSDISELEIDLSYLKSRIGLPGPVSKTDLASEENRRLAKNPYDFSESLDRKAAGKIAVDTAAGTFTLKGEYRDRNNPYVMGYNPLKTEAEQTDEITEDTTQLSLNHEYTAAFAQVQNTSKIGIDFYDTRYMREERNSKRKKGDIRKIEGFLFDELALMHGLSFSAGYRYAAYTGKFREDKYEDFWTVPPPPPPTYLYSAWVSGTPYKRDWDNHAYEFGLSWEVIKPVSLFASHSKSFRIPNSDEFILADSDLHPQTAMHYDAGVRLKMGLTAEFSCTFFRMITTDEIYYGETPGTTGSSVNRNYDEKTDRKGIELQIKLYPADILYFWGNYSYTDARFETTDTEIPLVPKHMGNVGFELYLLDHLTLAFSGTLASSCWDGNDQKNQNPENKLASYQVFDMKLTWQQNHFRIYAGVQNIFNELYVTSAYSGSGYPMAERAVTGGIEWTF